MVDKTATNPSADLEAQRAYVKEIEGRGFDFSLVVADAFVRGMRDIGYKSSAWAFCELIDNSIQAEASQVHVAFDNNTQPNAIAVIDDGHGMDPEMIRLSVVWGGSHRTKASTGFGKFGYGLPTASVSQSKRYSVYSRVPGGTWFKITIDLDAIREGKWSKGHKIEVPEPQPADLPGWIADYVDEQIGDLTSGTIVLLDDLDRIKPKRAPGLQNDFVEHFGVIYRNFLRDVPVLVNKVRVEPCDPLFLTPGARYYDIDDDRAASLDELAFDVTDKVSGETLGTVKVRYSSMPPTFARIPEDKLKPRGGKRNPRFAIIDENNGLIIMREGRQIDVITSKRDRGFWVNNDDRYWGVDIDFPAALDDELSITTSKQQVRLSDRIWDLLEKHGVFQTIKELRTRYDKQKADMQVRMTEEEKRRASELVMQEAEKFKTRKPEIDEAKQQHESQEELKREAKRRGDLVGVPAEAMEKQLVSQQQGREFIVETETMPGAPFYRVARRGGPKVLYINTAHRFYTRLYAPASDDVRAGLELLLWALGESELDSDPGSDRRRFYDEERHVWSRRLNILLDILEKTDGAMDLISTEPVAPPATEATA